MATRLKNARLARTRAIAAVLAHCGLRALAHIVGLERFVPFPHGSATRRMLRRSGDGLLGQLLPQA